MNRFARGLSITVALALSATLQKAQAATIDMVPVGNPGNAADTEVMTVDGTSGYGSVGYVYQIGKYEVTAGQYTEFLNAVAKADPNGLYNTAMSDISDRYAGANIQRSGSSPTFSYSVAADWANRPVNYVSFWDAARFANWLHNGQPTGPQGPGTTEAGAYHDVGNQTLFGRNAGAKFFIPSEDEWYQAAYHVKTAGLAASYSDYPTGSNTAPINTLPDPGNHANFYDDFGTGNNWYTIGRPYYRTEVGAFVNSASSYGTFDQGGNVFEWNETASGPSRGLRGGSFNFGYSFFLPASSRHFNGHTYEDTAVGFRVASNIPEPSTLLLLCFGSLAVLWRRRGSACTAILAAVFTTSSADRARGESIEWVRQLGTISEDPSRGVSADGLGNVYISGYTGGSLGGPSAGEYNAFVSKYDAAGTFQWSRQLGTSSTDVSRGVSADGLGNVYISGYTGGSLGGPYAGGGTDAFVSKYDASGTLQWTQQLGTSSGDFSHGVSADGLGNVYISGYTGGSLGGPYAGGGTDAFVSKYDASGTLQWTQQLGTSSGDFSHGVSADGLGNVYISGDTGGSLGGQNAGGLDAFVSKYDAAGNFQWSRQLGTSSSDQSYGVSADGLGNIYFSGRTFGSLGGAHVGAADAFVSKYDAAGNFQWTRQLGTSSSDESHGVSADGLGNVYISGYTRGSLGGANVGVADDAFVSKYDAAGTLQWTRQLGTSVDDESHGVSADGLGNIYFSGRTFGSLGGPNAGDYDAFVGKIVDSVVPEPNTLLLLCFGSLAVLRLRRRGLVCASILAAVVGVSFADPAAADTFGSGLNTFDIEFVSIGNPGNPADTTGNPNPAGSVPYTYRASTV